jgi:O-antigen/teichoic acid export membrane protein
VRIGVSNAMVTLLVAATSVATTPYLIARLGAASYGVFALTAAVSAQMSNLELGFGYSTIRFLSAAKASGDEDEAKRIIDTSLFVFILAAAVGGVGMLAAAPYLAREYADVPAHLIASTEASFRLAGLIVVASFGTSFVRVVLQALERFATIVWYQAFAGMLSTAVAVGTVALGGRLVAVLLGQLITALIGLASLGAALHRIERRVPRPLPTRKTITTMGRFGAQVFAGGIGYQIFTYGPLTVLGGAVPAAIVPTFSIPNTVVQRVNQATASASVALLPFLSSSHAVADEGALRLGYIRHLRISWLVSGVITVSLFFLSEPLMTLWLGPSLGEPAGTCLQWLAVGVLFLNISSSPAELARARGHALVVSLYAWGTALVATPLAMILVHDHGAPGVAVAVATATVVSTPPLVFYCGRRELDLTVRGICSDLALPTAAISCLGATLWFVRYTMSENLGVVVIGSALAALAYVASYILVLRPDERASFSAAIRRSA